MKSARHALALCGVGAALTAGALAAPGTASATTTPPAPPAPPTSIAGNDCSTVHVRHHRIHLCGIVGNDLNHPVTICWAWDGRKCLTPGTVAAHKEAGGWHQPKGRKDVDALYVPKGHRYSGYLVTWKLLLPTFKRKSWHAGWNRIHDNNWAAIWDDHKL